jgi:peptidoglycan/xylan/chitin deacetylase (PgdA/CDA1 family)
LGPELFVPVEQQRTRKWPARLLLVFSTHLLFAVPPGPLAAQGAGGPEASSRIVANHRRTILLIEHLAGLTDEDQERYTLAARAAYRRKLALESTLLHNLENELRDSPADGSAAVTELVDTILHDPDLHDADSLAFLDLADGLLSILEGAGDAGRSLLPALERLDEELAAIQEVYQEEIARILAKLGTRGPPPKREKWDDCVAFLRRTIDLERVLRELAPDGALPRRKRGPRPKTEREIFGTRLPKKAVVFTFDDGPHPRYTREILAILKQHGTKAYFFVLGRKLGAVGDGGKVKLKKGSSVARAILAAGHTLENHTYSHAAMLDLESDDRAVEIHATSRVIEQLTGAKPRFFRPPYGGRDDDLLTQVIAAGMRTVMWNVDSWDWGDPIPASIAKRVIDGVARWGRGVILFHDVHRRTMQALPLVLEELSKKGYRFSTLTAVAGTGRAPVKKQLKKGPAAATDADLSAESFPP